MVGGIYVVGGVGRVYTSSLLKFLKGKKIKFLKTI